MITLAQQIISKQRKKHKRNDDARRANFWCARDFSELRCHFGLTMNQSFVHVPKKFLPMADAKTTHAYFIGPSSIGPSSIGPSSINPPN